MSQFWKYVLSLCFSLVLLVACFEKQQVRTDSSEFTNDITFDCNSEIQHDLNAPPGIAPLFVNSVVSTDFDFITTDDSSEFTELNYIGRSVREMPGNSSGILIDDAAFVYQAIFSDTIIEIWLHSDFEDRQVARDYALKLTGPLGRLPDFMRIGLKHVVVQDGNAAAFGEHIGNFFVVYSKNMDTRIANHDLEETVFHESVHATMDFACEKPESSWNLARVKDNTYITSYAAELPEKEDLAESALFAYSMIKHSGRLPSEVESWIRTNTPNRLLFFNSIF